MLQADSATSGKYRLRSCPDFEVIARSFPTRERMQRNPSHFGSYCHCEPAGISFNERASIGAGPLLLIIKPHRSPLPELVRVKILTRSDVILMPKFSTTLFHENLLPM